MKKKKIKRIIKSFLLTAIIPAFVICIVSPLMIWINYRYPSTFLDDIWMMDVLFWISYVPIVIYLFLIGLPIFLMGRQLNAVNPRSCMGTGFVLGVLPVIAFVDPIWPGALAGGLLGACTGLAFWRFWIYGI